MPRTIDNMKNINWNVSTSILETALQTNLLKVSPTLFEVTEKVEKGLISILKELDIVWKEIEGFLVVSCDYLTSIISNKKDWFSPFDICDLEALIMWENMLVKNDEIISRLNAAYQKAFRLPETI